MNRERKTPKNPRRDRDLGYRPAPETGKPDEKPDEKTTKKTGKRSGGKRKT